MATDRRGYEDRNERRNGNIFAVKRQKSVKYKRFKILTVAWISFQRKYREKQEEDENIQNMIQSRHVYLSKQRNIEEIKNELKETRHLIMW